MKKYHTNIILNSEWRDGMNIEEAKQYTQVTDVGWFGSWYKIQFLYQHFAYEDYTDGIHHRIIHAEDYLHCPFCKNEALKKEPCPYFNDQSEREHALFYRIKPRDHYIDHIVGLAENKYHSEINQMKRHDLRAASIQEAVVSKDEQEMHVIFDYDQKRFTACIDLSPDEQGGLLLSPGPLLYGDFRVERQEILPKCPFCSKTHEPLESCNRFLPEYFDVIVEHLQEQVQ